MYKLTKRFTSRDGKLEVDDREFGMTQQGLDAIGAAKDQLGGATDIFARIDGGPATQIKFFTRDNGLSFVRSAKPESGWAVYEMEKGSGYNLDKGQVGWWNATVEGYPSEVADGIGLINGNHISTFLIFSWEADVTQPDNPQLPDDGGPQPAKTVSIYLYSDGTWEKAS